jgi:hypothetical protein
MATRRTSFSKLQRDRAKQAASAAKRERRAERANAEEIHRQFDAKQIDLEEFEEKKSELLARLPVD